MSAHDPEIRENEFEGRPELVKKRARAFILQRVSAGLLAVFMVASMTLLVANAIQGHQTRDTLLDCTTPSGECYKEGQERTAEVLDQLYRDGLDRENTTRQIIVLAAACAGDEKNRDIDDIEACVNKRLAEEFQINIEEVP